MKKQIYLILVVIVLPLITRANDYYYYHGNKSNLQIDSSKLVVILPQSITDLNTEPIFNNLKLLMSVSDSKNLINVYEITSSSIQQIKMMEKLTKNVKILPCYVNNNDKLLIPNGYLNVRLKSSEDLPKLIELSSQLGYNIIKQNEFMPLWYSLMISDISQVNPIEASNKLYESGFFASSFPSFSIDALEISYDPEVHNQWGLYNAINENIDISVSAAWNYATGQGIKIAIVDQGIDLDHIDLKDNISSLSYDTETNSSPSKIYGDHGTHCAGIAAAIRNNGIQISGVAPDAQLMSISNRLQFSSNLEYNLANGINWAWTNGADIISCSWQCHQNDMLEEAIDNAVFKGRNGKGCIFIKSAGNTGSEISYPGSYSENVLAVANIKKTGMLNGTSSKGDNLFVCAPGTDILSTLPNNKIGKMSGTSMAAPHVAGLVALILERNPTLTSEQVREIIATSAKKIGNIKYFKEKQYGSWDEGYGYGLIDAYKAVINTPRNK